MSETRPSDSCRICKFSFKVKFGNVRCKQFYSSSQNLFKPSHRKDSFGIVLADVCKQVGLVLLEDSQEYSYHVCNPCARKILTLGNLFEIVKTATLPTVPGTKRSLAAPEKASPSWRKAKQVRVNSAEVKMSSRMRQPKKSCKSLAFTGESGSMSTLPEKEEEMLRRLNMDDLPQTGLQVKAVYLNPLGNVVVRIPRDDPTKTLVKNLACENWREVSNAILQHAELAPKLRNSICKVLSKEFSEYLKSETMLCARNPDKLFMEEVRIFCPLWYNCVIGASGVSTQVDVNSAKDHNSLALATAILARVRNPQALAVHYRICTILFHSGIKRDDLNCLNRLGVCMSPDSIIRLQSKMNEQLEGKVKIWKATVEENRGALKLAHEVVQKQVSLPLDVSQQYLETYDFFSSKGYEYLIKLSDEEEAKTSVETYTTACVHSVIRRLESTKLPLYK